MSHSQSLVSTQEAEPPVTSAVCNGDLEANQGEHVRPLLLVQSFLLVALIDLLGPASDQCCLVVLNSSRAEFNNVHKCNPVCFFLKFEMILLCHEELI